MNLIISCVSSLTDIVCNNSQEIDTFIPNRRICHAILSHHVYSCCVLKVYLVYNSMKKKLVALMRLVCVEMHRQFHTYYLLMIP